MKKIAIVFFIICQYAVCSVWAETSQSTETTEAEVSGMAAVVGVTADTTGDVAKYNEYSDRDSGVQGDAVLTVYESNRYMELEGENMGREDQAYGIETGQYGSFKFNVYYDEIVHNYTFGARSYLDGVGTANLTDSGNAADPDAWTSFDYTKERKNVRFNGEFSFYTPYYVAFGGGRQQTDGVYPLGGPGGVELPGLLDWEENTWFAEGGFRGDALVANIRVDKSDFENANDALLWEDNITSLAPDSEYYKVSGKVILRQSFMDATLAVRARTSRKKNETDLSLLDASATGTYHGKVKNTGLDVSYDFVPADPLDIKLYGKYSDTDDDSDIITVNSLTTEPDDREKTSMGFEGTWQMNRTNFIDTGYQYKDAKRSSRTDNDQTKDHTLFMQYRNRSFERVDFQGKLERLDRSGYYNGAEAYEWSDLLDSYITVSDADDGRRRFDVADQIRYRLDLSADMFLTEKIDAAVEYAWWDSDYDDTVYGMTEAVHHQVYLTGNYTGAEAWLLSVYIGYEEDRNTLVTNRDWSQEESFDTVSYGLSLELPTLEERMDLTVSWDHTLVDGSTEFASDTSEYDDLTQVDDATFQQFAVKGAYRLNDEWTMKLGYSYERFDLDDGQYEGYTYLPSGAVLTGAYADQEYKAHIMYMGVAVDF